MNENKGLTIKKVYTRLKNDLELCIYFCKRWELELVHQYFNNKDANKFSEILKPLKDSLYELQRIEIEKLEDELLTYFNTKPLKKWTTTKKSKQWLKS